MPAATESPRTVSDPQPATAPPESHRAHTAEAPRPESKPGQPVRDVTVRLGSDNRHVDVKLIDRGGELHVAVHAADPNLTADLRASVHDLIGGLEKGGFEAETWQPADTPAQHPGHAASESAAAGDQPQAQTGDDPRQQGRNVYQPDYAANRHGRGWNRDSHLEWINQISALTGAESEY